MRIAVFLAVCLVAISACASTPAAWAALDAAARAACSHETLKLSPRARIARIAGRISGIGDDGDRYYGLLMGGRTAASASQWLCLYDKRARRAQVREIEN